MSSPASPVVNYMAFPFRIGDRGADVATRLQHISQQVEQVLLTSPGERVFRPDFGFGARRWVFEPNRIQSWEVIKNRLYGSLAEALAGDVDPKTLKVEVGAPPDAPERLEVVVTYVVAAINKEERHTIPL